MNETNCHSTSSPSSLSSQSSFATVNLFGIPVAKVTEEEAVARIIAFAKARNPQLSTLNSQLNSSPRSMSISLRTLSGDGPLAGTTNCGAI